MSSNWTQSVTLLNGLDSSHHEFYDALVAAPTPDEKYLITSPNMNYVPCPVWGRIKVSLKADGKCGIEDPMQWPQIYVPDLRWKSFACMPQKTHPWYQSEPWTTPSLHDLDAAGTGLVQLYTIKLPRQQSIRTSVEKLDGEVKEFESLKGPSTHLRWLQLTMHNNLDCLRVPSTLRDIIRQLAATERFYCMVIAWLTWDTIFSNLGPSPPRTARSDLVGCFTTSLNVVGELHRAGVPVWYMRLMSTLTKDFVVVSPASLKPPNNIVTVSGEFAVRPLYEGPPGQAQLEAIIYSGNQYIDIEALPFPAAYADASFITTHREVPIPPALLIAADTSSQAGPSRIMEAQKTKKQKRKGQPYVRPAPPKADPTQMLKFIDPAHEYIPPLLDGWMSALKGGAHGLQASVNSWGIWVPEPNLVVGSPTAARRERLRRPLMTRWWRSYLDDGFEPSSKMQPSHQENYKKAMAVFSAVFQDSPLNSADLRPMWFGVPVTSVDETLCRQVAWELGEMGFRVELAVLDHELLARRFHNCKKVPPAVVAQHDQWFRQVFPGGNPFYIGSLPLRNEGLGASNVSERSKCLEALRLLVQSWPDCPELLKSVDPLDQVEESVLASVEPMLNQFYVETFVKVANRAPTLPRHFPVTTQSSSPPLSSTPVMYEPLARHDSAAPSSPFIATSLLKDPIPGLQLSHLPSLGVTQLSPPLRSPPTPRSPLLLASPSLRPVTPPVPTPLFNARSLSPPDFDYDIPLY
ncbi:hypothetical protein BDY19DRAFT_993965 [Irpex rosettiformis]|uniref:Uncharacterized protein n=1 Tax=Irpex rosettiformis TaxID=378272 RepID=A0ACB8U2S4_9APHY|nr:hypothetical protein BDY19DRAFT_993965 [Irpex rosettiformis]